jgi:uncharacterized protein (DUF2237 family)
MEELNPIEWAKKVEMRGWLLFSKIWGSHSHDTQLPTSDVDYTGVYVAYNKDLLGLSPPGDTLTGNKPDYQIHEVKKFCDLLLKGNPAIIEMLFTEKLKWCDPKWDVLYEGRKHFLSANVVKQYLGYSVAQLQRLRHGKPVHSHGGIPGEKWCYHMVRVAWDAERIAFGGEPKVWKDGAEKEKLMAIRTGAWSTEQAVKEAEETIARIDARKPWPIPERANEKFLNDWLLWIRGISGWKPTL